MEFGPKYMHVEEVVRPKSVWVKELKAEPKHKFAVTCILSIARRYATYIRITNLSVTDLPTVTVSQEQFLNQFAGVCNGAFKLIEID